MKNLVTRMIIDSVDFHERAEINEQPEEEETSMFLT